MGAIRLLTVDPAREQGRPLEEQLSKDPGFEVVGRVSRPMELLLAVRSTEADAVVLFDETDERGILSHLFAEYPDLTVVALQPTGEAVIEERCPIRWTVADSSAAGILKALRDAVEQPCGSKNHRELNRVVM